MEKIRALMAKCGLTEEAISSICVAMEDYQTAVRGKAEQDYVDRVAAAKKVCIEETEKHKLELAKRLQIFCEAKAMQIEQVIAKQQSLREGEAAATLGQVKALLEGINITGDSNLNDELLEMRKQLDKVKEDRDRAVATANRQTKLAESVLKRNRQLESQAIRSERRDAVPGTVLGEATDSRQAARIDASRSGAAPRTTRRTITENQIGHGGGRQQAAAPSGQHLPTPAEIADSLADDGQV